MATKVRSTNFSSEAEDRISELGLDSALTLALIDSSYVQSHIDSDYVQSYIDSDYVSARAPDNSLLNALIFGG